MQITIRYPKADDSWSLEKQLVFYHKHAKRIMSVDPTAHSHNNVVLGYLGFMVVELKAKIDKRLATKRLER